MSARDIAFAIGVVAWFAACSDPLPTATTSPNLQVVTVSGVKLITRDPMVGPTMDALFQGRVLADDRGCIRLDSADDATVVWPHGFTGQPTVEGVVVRDASGDVVGRLGDEFSLPGGEVPALTEAMGFSPADRDLAEEHCPGRYWIVS